jgi:hypothetical protein
MITNNIIPTFIARKEEIGAARVLASARQRAADASAALSRRGAMQAIAELANESVNKIIELAYEPDTDGVFANVDRHGRLLIPAPWGRAGHQHYKLRRGESETLRHYMLWLQSLDGRPALFVYDPEVRSWFVNREDYPRIETAISYWRHYQIDARRWRACVQAIAKR